MSHILNRFDNNVRRTLTETINRVNDRYRVAGSSIKLIFKRRNEGRKKNIRIDVIDETCTIRAENRSGPVSLLANLGCTRRERRNRLGNERVERVYRSRRRSYPDSLETFIFYLFDFSTPGARR